MGNTETRDSRKVHWLWSWEPSAGAWMHINTGTKAEMDDAATRQHTVATEQGMDGLAWLVTPSGTVPNESLLPMATPGALCVHNDGPAHSPATDSAGTAPQTPVSVPAGWTGPKATDTHRLWSWNPETKAYKHAMFGTYSECANRADVLHQDAVSRNRYGVAFTITPWRQNGPDTTPDQLPGAWVVPDPATGPDFEEPRKAWHSADYRAGELAVGDVIRDHTGGWVIIRAIAARGKPLTEAERGLLFSHTNDHVDQLLGESGGDIAVVFITTGITGTGVSRHQWFDLIATQIQAR